MIKAIIFAAIIVDIAVDIAVDDSGVVARPFARVGGCFVEEDIPEEDPKEGENKTVLAVLAVPLPLLSRRLLVIEGLVGPLDVPAVEQQLERPVLPGAAVAVAARGQCEGHLRQGLLAAEGCVERGDGERPDAVGGAPELSRLECYP